MFKKLIVPLALLTSTSINAQTFEIDTETCAGVEHIQNESGIVVPYDSAIHTFISEDTPVFYKGIEQIPFIDLGPQRNTSIIVDNTTSSIVSFFFNPTYHGANGNIINLSDELIGGAFSVSNNPLDGAGANMPPNTSGTVAYYFTRTTYHGRAEILWDSSTCFDEPPLVTTVRQQWHSPSIGTATSYYYVNDGRNW
jgi:hypothetical protein